ncbi:MAG: response regulator [Trueperaceae bacterium]
MPSLQRVPRILVAVHQESDLEAIVAALHVNDPRVTVWSACSGQEVFEQLKVGGDRGTRGLPSLLLLDLSLQGPTGLEVLRRLRDCPRTNCLPIVCLSGEHIGGEGRSELVDEAYTSGANSCVTQPGDRGNLQAVVTRIAKYWLTLNQLPQEFRREAAAGLSIG